MDMGRAGTRNGSADQNGRRLFGLFFHRPGPQRLNFVLWKLFFIFPTSTSRHPVPSARSPLPEGGFSFQVKHVNEAKCAVRNWQDTFAQEFSTRLCRVMKVMTESQQVEIHGSSLIVLYHFRGLKPSCTKYYTMLRSEMLSGLYSSDKSPLACNDLHEISRPKCFVWDHHIIKPCLFLLISYDVGSSI